MQTYIPQEQATLAYESLDSLQYPHLEKNTERYLADMQFGLIDGVWMHAPAALFKEALHHFDTEPMNILDVGGGNGRHALILAALGHRVTCIDTDSEQLDLARERARASNVPSANFKPMRKDIRELTASDKYDAVISMMSLHFLSRDEAHGALRVMKEATATDGLMMVDAYTSDNPGDEAKRGLKYMFAPQELGRLCLADGWSALRNVEGTSPHSVARDHVAGPGKVLIPTVAEVIARKSVRRSYMNANREIVYL